jgi:hypothetical protein
MSPTVRDTPFSTASGGLLLALLAALNDVLDAHAAPREARGGVAVLQVARVGVRIGVTGGGLVLAVADGFFARNFRLFAYVSEK